MPIEGFPDSSVHKICPRCHKWFEPDEGVEALPEASGPISGMRNLGASMTESRSALRFMCHHCLRVRRNATRIIYGKFLTIVVVILILVKLHLI